MQAKPAILSQAAQLLLFSVFLLLCTGMVMLYSTRMPVDGSATILKQAFYLAIGIGVTSTLKFCDYRTLCRYSKFIIIIMMVPLGYLALVNILSKMGVSGFPFTRRIKGAYRWLSFGPVSLQVSEFAKIAIILFASHQYAKYAQFRDFRERSLKNKKDGAPWYNRLYQYSNMEFHRYPILMIGGILVLILMGRSLSVTVLSTSCFVFILFLAGIRLRWFACIASIAVAGIGLLSIFDANRLSRFTSAWDPEGNLHGSGYQLWQAHMALGGGGPLGRGMNKSLMKNEFLPEAHTDFILAVLGEEWGYLGIIFVVLMYIFFTSMCFLIAYRSQDTRGTFIAAASGFAICITAMLNLGVVSGLAPTTGVTAPLISYGGSSLLACSILIGLVLSVDHQNQKNKYADNSAKQIKEGLPS